MLILTRNIGQAIMIDGDKIEVVVLGIRGSEVKLGIKAPKDISIHREEILERIILERGEDFVDGNE